jgi:peptide/nickel transport system permease protein
MTPYVAKRVSLFIPTLLLVGIIIFLILRIIPGDPAFIILVGEQGQGKFTQEELNAKRRELGTDRHIVVQFGTWLGDMVRGDFGNSMWYGQPVWDELKEKFPTTLELIALAFLMGFGIAVPVGVISAVRQDGWLDYACRVFAITGTALPTFWVGILLIYLLVRAFDWVPPLGYAKLWEDPLKNLSQMIFPAIVLGYYNMAFIARVTRSAMLDVMREDYIRTAHSKGLRELTVISRHALKNAFLPVLTVSGWQMGRLIGGTVILESIFLVPGVGRTLIDGIFHRDFTMIQAVILLVAVGVLFLNLVIDLLYAWLDPRIRYI